MNYYNMSPRQKNIYEMAKRYGASCIGNIGGIIRYDKDTDETLLHSTATRVIELNPALGLRVDMKGRLYLGRPDDVYFEVIGAEDYSELQYDELVGRCTNIPIWGYDKSLVHYYMIKRRDCVCLLGMCHHIVCDGIGLVNVTGQLYQLGSDEGCELWNKDITPDNSYLDYLKECEDRTVISHDNLQKGEGSVASPYMDKNSIRSYISMWEHENISFPIRRESNSNKARVLRKMITQAPCEDILKWCGEHSYTVEHIYEAALARYYSEITGSGVTSLGRVVAGRRKQYMNTAGMFSNILPLFVEAGGKEDLTALCTAIKAQELQMLRCESIDADEVRAAKGITERMYDTSITYRPLKRLPVANGMHIDEVECDELELPLRILIDERSDGILLTYKYLSDIYTEKEIEKLHSAVMKLITAKVGGEGCARLLHPVFEQDDESCQGHIITDVVDGFYRYVKECPDLVCITDAGIVTGTGDKGLDITYRAAAGYIRLIEHVLSDDNEPEDKHAHDTGHRIGLRLSRSFRMPLAMIACLKRGITFVPISIDETRERLNELAMQTDRIIDDEALDEITGKDYISLFDSLSEKDAGEDVCRDNVSGDQNLRDYGNADSALHKSIAYAINTSGSTGTPKLVEIYRNSLNIRISWMMEELGLEGCRVLQKTRNTFDVSIWELLLPLVCRGTVVMLPDGSERDPSKIADAVSKYRIDTIHFVPSMLSAFVVWLESGRRRYDLSGLVNVISSGEALQALVTSKLYGLLPEARLYNLYGPAECTIDVSFHICKPDEKIIPIGVPVWDTDIRIINSEGMELPDGYIGEIVIAGELVGKGYVDNDIENGRHFVEHNGVRFYKTGDMGYIADNGEIIYTGRTDREIKLRGMRVNLDVLEREALSIQGVNNAAVIVSGSHMYLFVSSTLEHSKIRASLAGRLAPHYMPDTIITVDAIPVNANGKCDYNALKNMSGSVKKGTAIQEDIVSKNTNQKDTDTKDKTSKESLITIRNVYERTVAACISRVFDKNAVRPDDKLTDYGMDSLSVISIMVELEKAGYTLAYEDIYSAETVGELAMRLSQERRSFYGREKLICIYPWNAGASDTGSVSDNVVEGRTEAVSDNAVVEDRSETEYRSANEESRTDRMYSSDTVKNKKIRKLVLAVPYAGTDIHVFDTMADEFDRLGYTFAAFSIGKSKRSVETLADIGECEMKELIAGCRAEVILIGCCVGSALAVEIGKRLEKMEDVVCRLVLIGSLPGRFIGNAGHRKLLWDIVPKNVGSSLISALYGERVHVPESVYMKLRRDARRYTTYIEKYRKSADRVKIDALLIYGSRDLLTMGYRLRFCEWENYIDGDISVKELKGAYHFCTHTYARKIIFYILKWVKRAG